MTPKMEGAAVREHGRPQNSVQLGGFERADHSPTPAIDQRALAEDCAKRARFLAACAGLERGAEAHRIAALAAFYGSRAAALAQGGAHV